MHKRLWLSVMVLLALESCLGQVRIFVAPTGNDSHVGQSWNEAKQTIAGALAAAGSDATIYLQAGRYDLAGELTIPAGIRLKGGYSSASTGTDTTLRQLPQHNESWSDTSIVTLISGIRGHRLFTLQSGACIEGCVLQKGMSQEKGGGLLLDGGIASHCVIRYCTAHNDSQNDAKGGGVYMQNNAQLLNCVVCYNRADIGHGVAGNSGDAVNNTITQNQALHCGNVSDYDGNIYTTVVIGTQCWMREHLRTTHYANGDPVFQGDGSSTTTPLYYNIGSSGAETILYGLLYNLRAARNADQEVYSDAQPSGIQGICPNGWHLPSDAEFETMMSYLSEDVQHSCDGSPTSVGKALAAPRDWSNSTSTCAVGNDLTTNNSTFFEAQPAGIFDGSVTQINNRATFWTTSRTDNVSTRCTYRYLDYNEATLGTSYAAPTYGCSVRCLKNY